MAAILDRPYERDGSDIRIGEQDYHLLVMESDYDDGFQISAKEGDLVFFRFVTYGYGDTVEWAALVSEQRALDAWAKETSAKHACDYRIEVSANYW